MDEKKRGFYTNPGNRYHQKYSPRVADDGQIELVPDGIEDLQEFYNSQLDQTDMALIVQRWLNGDPSVLAQREGFYGDALAMPGSYRDILQAVIDGQRMFAQLPAEIRERFDNDFNQWFAAMDDEKSFAERMSLRSESEAVPMNKESPAETVSQSAASETT